MEQSDRALTRLPPAHFSRISKDSSCNFLFITCNFLQNFFKFFPFQINGKQDGDPLWIVFFNTKKTVSQCEDQTLRSTAKTLVIQFDQEKFEKLLS